MPQLPAVLVPPPGRAMAANPVILVTGGTGFIGRQLIPSLVSSFTHLRLAVRRQLEFPGDGVAQIPIGDLGPDTDWQMALAGVDCVIHLAGRAHMLKETAADPAAEFERVNHLGTLALAQQALDAGVKQFIFISSIGAMGTLSAERLDEDSPCYPDTDYGRSKSAAEQDLIALCQGGSMTYSILRPMLVYGPGNPGNMERLIRLIQLGLPLPLASLKNQRSFVYVGNLVAAIQACIGHPGAANQIFIVSDDEDLSTPDLVRQLAKGLKRSVWLWPCPLALLRLLGKLTGQRETINRLSGSLVVDSHKIRKALEWQAPFRAEQGLAATAASWAKAKGTKE